MFPCSPRLDGTSGGLEQAGHDTARVELAATCLADEPDRFARIDLEIDAVDRMYVADVVLEQDALGDPEVL